MKRFGLLLGAVVWIALGAGILALMFAGIFGVRLPHFTDIPVLGGLSVSLNSGTKILGWGADTLVKQESFDVAGVEKIEFDARYYDLNVAFTDGAEMTVKQYDINADNPFNSTKSNGKIYVGVDPFSIYSITFFGIHNQRIDIEMPRQWARDVSLNTGSGTIKINRAPEWNAVALSSGSGGIRLDGGIKCLSLEIRAKSGSVKTGGAIQAGEVSITTTSGSQNLDGIDAGGNAALNSSSGSIYLGDASASDFEIKTRSGGMRVGKITAIGDIALESTSGSINGSDLKAENVAVNSSSGSIKFGDIAAAGDTQIKSRSGGQNMGKLRSGRFYLNSGSGTLRYDGIAGNGEIITRSGSINCDALDIAGDSTVSSLSGAVRLTLERGVACGVRVETVSGAIRAADGLGLAFSDGKRRKASGGVGDNPVGMLDISTTSGGVYLETK